MLKSYQVDDRIPSVRGGMSTPSPSKSKSVLMAHFASHNSSQNTLFLADDPMQARSEGLRAVLTLTKSALGAGILMLPYCFAQLGVLVGTVALLVAGTLTAATLQFLLIACQRVGCADYLGLASNLERRHRWIQWLTGTCVLLLMLAPVVVSIQLTTRYASNLLLFGAPLPWGTTWTMSLILSVFLFWPISLVTDANRLSALNVFGLLGVLYVVVLTAAEVLLNGTPASVDLRWVRPMGDWMQIGGSLTTIFFCFSCHFNLPSTMQDLRSATPQQTTRFIEGSCFLTGLTYAIAGICGYLRFGPGVHEDLLMMRPELSYQLGRLFMILVNVASFPLLVIPMRNQLDAFMRLLASRDSLLEATAIPSHLFADKDPDGLEGSLDSKVHLQSALIILGALLITAVLGSPGRVFSLLGALCGGPVLFLLPVRFYRASMQLVLGEGEAARAAWMLRIPEAMGWLVTAFGIVKLLGPNLPSLLLAPIPTASNS